MLYFNLNIGNSWEPPHYFVKVHSLPKVIQNSRELLLMYETNKFQNDLEVKGYSNISWYKGGGSRIVPLVIWYKVSLFEEKVSVFICKIFRLKRNEEEVSWITGRVVWNFRNWRITPTRSGRAKKLLSNCKFVRELFSEDFRILSFGRPEISIWRKMPSSADSTTVLYSQWWLKTLLCIVCLNKSGSTKN